MNDVIDDALDSEDDEEEESENILRQVRPLLAVGGIVCMQFRSRPLLSCWQCPRAAISFHLPTPLHTTGARRHWSRPGQPAVGCTVDIDRGGHHLDRRRRCRRGGRRPPGPS